MTEIKKPKKNNIFTKCFDDIPSNEKKRIKKVDSDPKIDEIHHSCICSPDNFYDVSGKNYGLALTITDYDKPLTMRSSAIKDNSNLKFALEKRGFEMSLISGRVTSHDFKQKLSNTLQKIDSKKVTSFLLSISCHGEDDELLFSEKSRYESLLINFLSIDLREKLFKLLLPILTSDKLSGKPKVCFEIY